MLMSLTTWVMEGSVEVQEAVVVEEVDSAVAGT